MGEVVRFPKAYRGAMEAPRQQEPFGEKMAFVHAMEALKFLAGKRCVKKECGTICLCPPCHARKALEFYEPDWNP